MDQKAIEVLQIIESNGRVTVPTLAKMVDATETEVQDILKKLEDDILICAPGFSCRHQIADGTGKEALHPVQILDRFII